MYKIKTQKNIFIIDKISNKNLLIYFLINFIFFIKIIINKYFSFKTIIMNIINKLPSNFRGTYPTAGKFFVYGAGVCLLLSGYSYVQASSAQK
jgi:hypothetical protein